ncbi:hypothetical protein BDW74DRAFT_123665 [Aspergillus multicolor]|uniref:uncharacterized protein n=1 Tax=Aspergillus multicolor TaxID=41759 RepID=UPI003CCC9C92
MFPYVPSGMRSPYLIRFDGLEGLPFLRGPDVVAHKVLAAGLESRWLKRKEDAEDVEFAVDLILPVSRRRSVWLSGSTQPSGKRWRMSSVTFCNTLESPQNSGARLSRSHLGLVNWSFFCIFFWVMLTMAVSSLSTWFFCTFSHVPVVFSFSILGTAHRRSVLLFFGEVPPVHPFAFPLYTNVFSVSCACCYAVTSFCKCIGAK